MLWCSTGLLLSFLLINVIQTPRDSFRERYEKAEAYRRAGNLTAAENEFDAILSEAYHTLGRIYTAEGNYKVAAETLESGLVYSEPKSSALLTDLAMAYFSAGDYNRAITQLTKALAIEPKSAPAHQMLGKSYFMLGEFEKASNELEVALQLHPNDFDVEYTLGLTYLKLRKFSLAKRVYDQSITHIGSTPLLHLLVGHAYRETGFLAEAIDEFKRAATLDPKLPRVHYYLGQAYLLKDGSAGLEAAAREMELELAAHPDEFLANYYLGLIHISRGSWEASLHPLDKASKLQPENPDSFFLLGQAYQMLGKYEDAITAFRNAIKFNPSLDHNDYQVTNAHYRLGQSLLKTGRSEEGQKELQIASDLKAKAFKTDKEKLDAFLTSNSKLEAESSTVTRIVTKGTASVETADTALKADAAYYEKVIAAAHNNIGMLRAERQDFRQAIDQFQFALKWNPQLEGLNFNLGLACYKAEMYQDAVAPLEKELRASPASLTVRQFLGLTYFALEDYVKAAALLREVVTIKSNDAALYYPLAVSLGMQGKKEEADQIIRQMVALGENSPQVHILLGRAYYGMNDSDKALQELNKAVALDNKVLLAHFYSGLIYVKSGKLDEAAKEFGMELALNPRDIQAKYHFAYVALARQDTARGIELMREVIRDKPDYPNAHFELGNALLKQGDIVGAVKSLETAAKLRPGEAYVHYQLGRAYIAAGRQAEGETQLEVARQIKEKALRQSNP